MESSDAIKELTNALKEALNKKGTLLPLKARLRKEIIDCMDNKELPPPEQPEKVQMASSLICDFLETFEFESSLNVFTEESGHEITHYNKVNRSQLAHKLGIPLDHSTDDIPLLVLIVDHLLNSRLEKEWVAF